MYSANICKACLRVCKRKNVGAYESVSRRYINYAAINNPRLENGKPYKNGLLSSRRGQNTELALACHKARYSTGNNSLDSVLEDVCRIDKTAEDSLDSLTTGPPEELMQSLGEENQRKLKVLWMELEVFRQTGCAVPRKMTSLQWQEAMEKDTRSQRLKFYRFLCIKEARKEKEKLKKIAYHESLETVRAERELAKVADPLFNEKNYGLCKNTIFLRFYDGSLNAIYNTWQCQAIQFGQSIVIDLGYDDQMVKREASNCAEQIRDLYGFNKMNRQPFHLHFCNASPGSQVLQFVKQLIPNLYLHSCMINITEESYLDVFPKENLVYLTPHCKNELKTFDHDAVYIIGGLVDKTIQQPISLAKAKREGIAMARLPLDHYLDWGEGTKSLTLDQMMKIMLDIKNTNCWNTALQHVPKRKLKNGETSVPFVRPRFRSKRSLFNDEQ